MRLIVTTPTAIAVDQDKVRYVRAEDRSGAFGIAPGHTNFLTVLRISVLIWRDTHETEHYVAVRGGVLRVSSGNLVEVATREAVTGTDLTHLRAEVLAQMARNFEAEQIARLGALKLERAAIRRLSRYLRPTAQPFARPTRLGEAPEQ
jgi:F-type H+-transporting ATPase subunit epsilon